MPVAPEIPPRVTPTGDPGYFGELTKAIFRSGFSWRVVSDKWDNFRRAFQGFDVPKVGAYTPLDLEQLAEDASIVRNRRKLEATIENARRLLDLIDSHGSTWDYLRSMDHLDYYGRVKELTRQFRGLGRTGAFVFLHCVNEPHPSWEER